MSPADAFASGSGVSAHQVALLIVGVIGIAVLLWGGWALLSVWRGWARNRVRTEDFQYVSVRIVLMIVLIIWIVT